MSKLKASMIVFSESRAREDVYQNRKPVQERETEKLIQNLASSFDIKRWDGVEVRGKEDGRAAARDVNHDDSDVVLLYIPIFINPAIVAHTAAQISKPIAVIGNKAPDSQSQLGYLAASGAMEQVGIRAHRIPYDGADPRAKEDLKIWAGAATAKQALRGQTFGCIGGRSLGISTGTVDPAMWAEKYGIDVEQVDQLELVNRALSVTEAETEPWLCAIEAKYGKVLYDESQRFGRKHLHKMVASYLAMESIIRDYELDFAGIKCQPELSNGFCLQCLNVQMLNDPYDILTGKPKAPFVCSCEADADGALTMQILKLISGGKPTALQDIANISEDRMVLANCGSMASWFAACSDQYDENLKQVHLMPHGFGKAGGAATQFVCEKNTYTYARLFKKQGQYSMGIFTGETEKLPREETKKYSPYRPTSFVRHHIDSREFLETFCSNHLHCVAGDYAKELNVFCDLAGIKPVNYDRTN